MHDIYYMFLHVNVLFSKVYRFFFFLQPIVKYSILYLHKLIQFDSLGYFSKRISRRNKIKISWTIIYINGFHEYHVHFMELNLFIWMNSEQNNLLRRLRMLVALWTNWFLQEKNISNNKVHYMYGVIKRIDIGSEY